MAKRIVWLLAAIFLVSTYAPTSEAEAPTPGSSDDPVITKSYFDKNTLSEDKVKQLIADAIAKSATSDPQPTPTPPPSGGAANGTAGITVIQLKAGQTLYAGEGSEFIVRTGRTVAVSNDENGIPDVTGGKDIAAGSEIATNHLLIFPREGRGIKPAAKNTADIYVMVRGGYLLLNADGSTATP